MSPRQFVIIAATGCVLCACSFAPRYSRPTTETPPPVYREAAGWKTAQPADEQDRGPWWEIYQDQELNALEGEATNANQNIKAAFARLQQARAQTRI